MYSTIFQFKACLSNITYVLVDSYVLNWNKIDNWNDIEELFQLRILRV